MPSDKPPLSADASVVQAWITGWALARETSPPLQIAGGFRVDVGWPRQLVRYVFPRCSEEVQRLAAAIVEPWFFLKVCGGPEDLRPLLPPRWVIQPIGYLMTCSVKMPAGSASVPEGYSLKLMDGLPVPLATIHAPSGEVVASGRVALTGDFAIYDRIETHLDHRRRGLASAVVSALAAVAQSRGQTRGVLVATPDGRSLYETLGWRLHSLYTTAVIPGPTTNIVK